MNDFIKTNDEIAKMGFLKALFRDDIVINYDTFNERMQLPECKWILCEKEIR